MSVRASGETAGSSVFTVEVLEALATSTNHVKVDLSPSTVNKAAAKALEKKEDVISKLKDTELMMEQTAMILEKTQQTEASLTEEASKLLTTLKHSIAD
eukprot:9618389-Ditylum_brightwellii.AAC.1